MIEKRVEAFLNHHNILLKGSKIVVGVSGGPDSLALLHYLWCKQEDWDIELIAVHLDHMFRGKESYLEALFVEEFCKQYGIRLEWKQINVNQYLKKTGQSVQVGARECRYHYFEEVMRKYDAGFLALGHHGDDQVETMLMRMTRGSSGKARSGIPVKRRFATGELIRPFLAINKEEIEAYCRVNQLNPRRDPSNDKPYYSRNRFRSEVVNFLKRENPTVHEQFQRMSEELSQDELFLEELTVEHMNRVMKSRNEGAITLDIKEFLTMPIALQRRGIQLILNYLYKVRPPSLSAIHIDLIFSLFRSPNPSGKLDFPEGLQVIRSYLSCHFVFNKKHKESYQYEHKLSEPGIILLPTGSRISFEYVNQVDKQVGLDMIVLDPQKIEFPIVVRTRKVGDRVYPKGMSGTKKIKDIFIDQKIPLSLRDEWPVVTDGKGTILWLPGLKHSFYEASSETLDTYLLLTFNKH